MTGESDVAWTVGVGPTARWTRGGFLSLEELSMSIARLQWSMRGRSIAATWLEPR